MENESVKKSLMKSKNDLAEKSKNGQANKLHEKKINMFTIIATHVVREQLEISLT